MDYTLTRSKNRRRSLSLKVANNGEVLVRAPLHIPNFLIKRFVTEHTPWILKQQALRKLPPNPKKKYFSSTQELLDFIALKLAKYTRLTGLKPTAFHLRKVTSYWGSCSPKAVLSFNQKLLYAPPECVEYIVVHELAHLKHRGHGKRFWGLVTKLYPDTKLARKKLRQLPKSLT